MRWHKTKCLTVILAIASFIYYFLSPGGFGFTGDELVSTVVEKDPDGKIIKTVSSSQKEPDKTFWDWLSVLVVPFAITLLGYSIQKSLHEKIEEKAEENAKDLALENYFKRISAIVIDKQLHLLFTTYQNDSCPEKVFKLSCLMMDISALTISVLRQLKNDGERKASVIKHLHNLHIISKLQLDLSNANLSYIKLSNIEFIGAKLDHADFTGATLLFCKFQGASLCSANFQNADLQHSNLSNATLMSAQLKKANLAYANLAGADLRAANFKNANLLGTDLSNANLFFAEELPDSQISKAQTLCETKLPSDSKLNANRDCNSVMKKSL